MKACPHCDREVQDAAVKCRHCGSMLGPSPWPTSEVEARPAPATRVALQYSHSGARYLLGYGVDFFAIWDRSDTQMPVRTYPRTEEGWRDAWTDFAAWDPEHVQVGLGSTAVSQATGPPRVSPWWWALPILVGWLGGIIAWAFVRERDRRLARLMLATGLVLSAVTVLAQWAYYSSNG